MDGCLETSFSNGEVLVVAMVVGLGIWVVATFPGMQVNKKGVDHDRSDPLGWYGIRRQRRSRCAQAAWAASG